jgi:hypothetical protein
VKGRRTKKQILRKVGQSLTKKIAQLRPRLRLGVQSLDSAQKDSLLQSKQKLQTFTENKQTLLVKDAYLNVFTACLVLLKIINAGSAFLQQKQFSRGFLLYSHSCTTPV